MLGACRELAPSKQESTTYEPSLVCKLLILGCRLLIPDRLLAHKFGGIQAAFAMTDNVLYRSLNRPACWSRRSPLLIGTE